MLLRCRNLLKEKIKNPKIDMLHIDGQTLDMKKLCTLGQGSTKVQLSQEAKDTMAKSRVLVENILTENRVAYGINTGFGKLSHIVIPNDQVKELQKNLIVSHSTGLGKYLNLTAARRVHALRINSLAKTYSGISLATVEKLVDLFNAGIVPAIPEIGTVGASGDLAPLAHIALGLIGEGELWDPKTQTYSHALDVLNNHGLQVADLQAKDGLGLINGTAFITGVGSIALEAAINIIKSIQPISALSMLALLGKPQAFDPRIHAARNSAGQIAVADIMRHLLPVGYTVENTIDLQDPYSLRCIPQVHGPTLESIVNVKYILENEFNSASDNPLVFLDKEPHIVSGGNFHGEYPAKALDMLAIYTHEIGSMSYVRMKRMLNPAKSLGLPPFLTGASGRCSGMMIWENTAASLVSENKVLCHPSSTDSAETSADKEDHVSMGGFAARKAVMVCENVLKVIAIELFVAIQALHFRFQKDPEFYIHHPALKNIYKYVSRLSPRLDIDRYTLNEYNSIHSYIGLGHMYDQALGDMAKYSMEDQIKKRPDGLYLKKTPTSKDGNIVYTKTRQNQTQLGQLTSLHLQYDQGITEDALIGSIKARRSQIDNKKIISILDASEDDLGARANFGRGNTGSFSETAYDQFLKKFANFQVNKANKDVLNSLYLIGSIDISDLKDQCTNKQAEIEEERQILINSLKELNNRSSLIVKSIFKAQSNLVYMNGDHNNMAYVVGGFFEAYKKKPIVIYLDLHTDARNTDDGPHSGTWLTEVFEKGQCEKAYAVGISLFSNNAATIENMDKFNVTYQDYTWDNIQRMGSPYPLLQIAKEVVQSVKSKYGNEYPVILSVCGDTVQGLPCSAQNEVIGYPPEDVYPMIAEITKNLNVQCFNISELKPSLDQTKNLASGEFLAASLYLYASTINKKLI